MNNWHKILIISPHTDDAELCMGGVMSKMVVEDKHIHHAVFSPCALSVPEDLPAYTLRVECASANHIINIEYLEILEYEVRYFPEHRQAILDDMIRLRGEVMPDVVFIPSSYDNHQDHEVISQEAIRAFGRYTTILGYEHPIISSHFRGFRPDMFIKLDQVHVEKKLLALSEYKSQANRPYFEPDFLRNLAHVRGVQCGARFAEAFEVIRVVL